MPRPDKRQQQRAAELARQQGLRRRAIVLAGTSLLALVIVVVLVTVLVQRNQPIPEPTPTGSAELAYPPNATPARDGIVISDNPGKPDVGLYFDYQCSHCVGFERSFAGALALLGETREIRLVHHTRVFLDRGDSNGLSHKAARAAACADVVGGYLPYHTAIFESATSGPYTDQLLLETIPAKLGITGTDLTAFRSCYTNQNLAPFVANVEDAALKAGFTETPLLTVNGRPVPATAFVGKTGADLKGIIEAAAKG